jgi:membrane fusion protein, copper/silver efflux system
MKKAVVLFAIVLVVAIGGGFYFISMRSGSNGASAERKVAFYQSSMHPWIKSDRPGTCTICGMKLTPIYEGEKGFVTEGEIVTLGTNRACSGPRDRADARGRWADRDRRATDSRSVRLH